jgi:hypothetical protein
MQGKAVLFSEMTPAPAWEAEFNGWYDQEHIPLRMGAPGFISARRYRSTEHERNYLAIYEMESAAALKTPEYQEIKNKPSPLTTRMLKDVTGFSRYIGEQIGVQRAVHAGEDSLNAQYLYSVAFGVPEDAETDFNDWYEQDHVPLLLECKQWLLVRRFRISDGQPRRWTHLALHYLSSLDALASPERAMARATPWRAKLARFVWFQPEPLVFVRYGKTQSAQ